MQAIIPYLSFTGNASEALSFYAKALGGETVFQQTFGESPMPVEESFKNKIMHATFKAGDLTIMCSDVPDQQTAVIAGTNVSLSLNFDDVESINNTFAALAEGGKVTMDLQDTFWGARFGMITDQFGINWMFNHDYKTKDHS